MNRREKEPIDFVITWVDGNDPKWQEEKDKKLIAQGLGGHIDGRRSEERRVGKECRSRWSPYH